MQQTVWSRRPEAATASSMEVRQLRVWYGDKEVLKGVDLQFPAGQAVNILFGNVLAITSSDLVFVAVFTPPVEFIG